MLWGMKYPCTFMCSGIWHSAVQIYNMEVTIDLINHPFLKGASLCDSLLQIIKGCHCLTKIAELDSTNPKLMTESRIMRIARGSGRTVRDVMEMIEEYKRLAKIWGKMKGLKIPKKGDMSALSRSMNAQHMSKVLPPQMLKQIGGMGGLQSLMKQMGSNKDMASMFGGLGGLGGPGSDR
jgi:Signal peptide binding domain